jgi:ribosome-associated translation inhibitor RaiA
MTIALQTTYRSFSPPIRADRIIRDRLKALEQLYPNILSCTLTAEQSHSHQLTGMMYRVAIAVTLADGNVIADHDHHNKHAHEDFFAAAEDAFVALENALKSHPMDKTAVR